jgi:hypothetical protein
MDFQMISIRGFGVVFVKGLSLVPSPAVRIIAFIFVKINNIFSIIYTIDLNQEIIITFSFEFIITLIKI